MSDKDRELLERIAHLIGSANDLLSEMTDPLPLPMERLWGQVQCGLLTAREGVTMMRRTQQAA